MDKEALRVKHNLTYHHLWSNLSMVDLEDQITVILGTPPVKTSPSDSSTQSSPEWVLPIHANGVWSVSKTDNVFRKITKYLKESGQSMKTLKELRPQKIIMAMINDDGTIVYYIVKDGVAKPRKN